MVSHILAMAFSRRHEDGYDPKMIMTRRNELVVVIVGTWAQDCVNDI